MPPEGVARPLRATGCPSLRRIVQAKDGGICRIKLPCGRLSSRQARAIADVAILHAGNIIEITNRSNIQLRGVDQRHVSELTTALLDAGLGADDNGSDEVRNVMVSPTAGIDPQQIVDATALASQLLTLLQAEKRFHALSAKFAIAIDGGERMAMLQHPHDLWLSAVRAESQVLFAFGLAGVPPVAGANAVPALAAVAPQHALALIAAVLHQFLDCASLEQKRMRDLLQQMTAQTFLQQLRQRVDFPLFASEPILQWRRQAATPHAHIGITAQIGDRCTVGAVPSLGRLDGAKLLRIAAIAEHYGDAAIHLTPWQSILLPDIAVMEVDRVLLQLKAIGLHVSNDQPLAHLVACSGTSGCAKGLADTKADALQLADQLDHLPAHFMQVHLTGCGRSCACAYAAPFTLLAVDDGRYDLFLHADGDRRRTDDTEKFGTRVASSIDITVAAAYLRQFSKTENLQ